MKAKSYRVIQWGTGNVGRHALRGIVTRPDYELVGLKVYSDDKAGLDAGDLVGEPPTGILATTSVEEILAVEADCVNYNALGTTEDMYGQPLDDICMLLSKGYNVTTTAIDAFVYPPSAPRQHVQRLEEACAEGSTSFFGSGIDPGYTHDLFPITLTRLSRQVDRIRALEVLNMRNYSSASAMGFMGFGKDPSEPSALDAMHSDPANSVFYTCMLMVADALRFELEDYRYEREIGLTDVPVETAFGTIEAGTVAAIKIAIYGVAFGRDVLQFEWVWRVSDDVRPEWGTGEFWEHEIDGDPWIRNRLEAATTFDSKRITSITVATTALNAIPTVCEAPPGVHTALTLPTWGGGFVGPTTIA
jgi:4-hydroxy-tetrahydrodipicolinate reductase